MLCNLHVTGACIQVMHWTQTNWAFCMHTHSGAMHACSGATHACVTPGTWAYIQPSHYITTNALDHQLALCIIHNKLLWERQCRKEIQDKVSVGTVHAACEAVTESDIRNQQHAEQPKLQHVLHSPRHSAVTGTANCGHLPC